MLMKDIERYRLEEIKIKLDEYETNTFLMKYHSNSYIFQNFIELNQIQNPILKCSIIYMQLNIFAHSFIVLDRHMF